MADASITRVFDAPIDVVYNMLIDYENYPDFVDSCKTTDILEESEEGAVVEYKISIMMKKFKYTLNMVHEKPNSVKWSFESGDLFNVNDGQWTLKDLGDGTTEATYDIDIDFKIKVPDMILNKLVGSNLPSMMEDYHERAKELS